MFERCKPNWTNRSKNQANVENLLISGAISANTRQSLLDQIKQMQTNNTALQISIRETELEAARLQGEYDVLNAAHRLPCTVNKTRQPIKKPTPGQYL